VTSNQVLSEARPGRSGIVGGPVTSVETVGVLPDVGGFVSIGSMGAGLGGSVLQMSMYSHDPFKNDPIPKLSEQHEMRLS